MSRMTGLIILVFCASLALSTAKDLHYNEDRLQLDEFVRYFPDPDEAKPGPEATGNHWAVIVAGSNGWYNYRHQADACHAFQVLTKHGVSEDRIITLMYDDIAHNEQNPTPGVVINHINGPNVYTGVKIDYKREDVTPEVFLAVLSGDKEAVTGMGTGRVVESGPNDHVFVNFVDHGAPGILAFPMSELHAKDLMKTIKTMNKQRKYNQMVFYVEACESGSMFHHLLPKNISVYATTAANPTESSYACYMDETLDTYLGDVYSVKWMEDSDKENLGIETLHKQYGIVKHKTNTSHVMQYGDRDISTEVVAEFQGNKDYKAPDPLILPDAPLNAVPSEDVRATILYHKLAKATTPKQKYDVVKELEQLYKEKEQIETTVRHIVGLASKDDFQISRVLTTKRVLANIECYDPVARHFDQVCYDLSQHEFALRNLYPFVNLCEEGVPATTIITAISQICRSHIF